jgi:hypothetical protein
MLSPIQHRQPQLDALWTRRLDDCSPEPDLAPAIAALSQIRPLLG